MDKTHNNRSMIIDLYNSAYDSYLLSIDPVIILHTYITDLVKLLNAQCSAVMKYDSRNQTFEIVTHASCSSAEENKHPNEIPAWLIFSNYVRKNNKLNSSSIITKCISECKIRVERNCRLTTVLGIDHSNSSEETLDIVSNGTSDESVDESSSGSLDFLTDDTYLDDFSKIVRETILFIPCCTAGTPHGVIVLCFDKPFDGIERDELLDAVLPIENMMGVLMYNMTFRPLHIDSDRGAQTGIQSGSQIDCHVKEKRGYNTKQIDSSVTFQLIHDTLNAVTDAIVVTDTDMRIVYKNEQFVNTIKSIYQIDTLPEYIIDIIPQTITLMGSKDGDARHSSSFYRNKKIEVEPRPNSGSSPKQSQEKHIKLDKSTSASVSDTVSDTVLDTASTTEFINKEKQNKKSNTGTLDIHVNSTVSCGDIYHIFRLRDSDASSPDTVDKSKSSKNLIAYMSHELRNPIQAISTGVYLIDRTIKSMNKKKQNKIFGPKRRIISDSAPDCTSDSTNDSTIDLTNDSNSDLIVTMSTDVPSSILSKLSQRTSPNVSPKASTNVSAKVSGKNSPNIPNTPSSLDLQSSQCDSPKTSLKNSGKNVRLRRKVSDHRNNSSQIDKTQNSIDKNDQSVCHNTDQTSHCDTPANQQAQSCAEARCSVLLRRSYIDPNSKDADKESDINDNTDCNIIDDEADMIVEDGVEESIDNSLENRDTIEDSLTHYTIDNSISGLISGSISNSVSKITNNHAIHSVNTVINAAVCDKCDKCDSPHSNLLIKDDFGEVTMIECCSGAGNAEVDKVFDKNGMIDTQILTLNKTHSSSRSNVNYVRSISKETSDKYTKSNQFPDSPASGDSDNPEKSHDDHSYDNVCSTESNPDVMRDSSLSYGSDNDTSESKIYLPSRKGSGQSDQDSNDVEFDQEFTRGVGKELDLIENCDMSDMKLMSMDTLRGIIKRVSSACKNMNIIIDDILDLSKIDNDELIMNLDEHSLQEIAEMIVEESKSEVRKKGLKFVYEFDESCPETIYTDGTRVFQIISNLVSNSIKYSTTGTIKFRVGYDGDANTIIFQVSDQGRGIRKEEIPNLFKQFGRTSNSVTEINSTGLGLCVCQKIASLLGGSIDVTSEYRKGSTFTFTHPIKLGYSGTRADTEQSSQREIKGDVLIVDDDPNITSLFKLLLRCMNYDKGYELNIETANNGDKALMMANIKQYSLIFMDIDLDGEDGCTICNRILNDSAFNRATPVVAVTANIKSVQHDRDPRFNQFNDVVLKPFNNKNISECLIKHLGCQN